MVDLDLEKFFDKVIHTRLMARLARDIRDGTPEVRVKLLRSAIENLIK